MDSETEPTGIDELAEGVAEAATGLFGIESEPDNSAGLDFETRLDSEGTVESPVEPAAEAAAEKKDDDEPDAEAAEVEFASGQFGELGPGWVDVTNEEPRDRFSIEGDKLVQTSKDGVRSESSAEGQPWLDQLKDSGYLSFEYELNGQSEMYEMVLVGSDIDIRVSREAKTEILEQREPTEPTTLDQASKAPVEAAAGGEATSPEIAASEFLAAAQAVAEQRAAGGAEVNRERRAAAETQPSEAGSVRIVSAETSRAETVQSTATTREIQGERQFTAARERQPGFETAAHSSFSAETGQGESRFSAATTEARPGYAAETLTEASRAEPQGERDPVRAAAIATRETNQTAAEIRPVVTAAELPTWVASRVTPEPASGVSGRTAETTPSERADAAGIVLYVDDKRWESPGSNPKTYRVTVHTSPAAAPQNRPAATERVGRTVDRAEIETGRHDSTPERSEYSEPAVPETVGVSGPVAERSRAAAATGAAGAPANGASRSGNAKGSKSENALSRAAAEPVGPNPALPEAPLPRGEAFSESSETQNVFAAESTAVIDSSSIPVSEADPPAAAINSGAPARQNFSGTAGLPGEPKSFDGSTGTGSPETGFPGGDLETGFVGEMQDQTGGPMIQTSVAAVFQPPQTSPADQISSPTDTGERGPQQPGGLGPENGAAGLTFEQTSEVAETVEKVIDEPELAAQDTPLVKAAAGSEVSPDGVAPKAQGEQGGTEPKAPERPDGGAMPEAALTFDIPETEAAAEFTFDEFGEPWEEADAVANRGAMVDRSSQLPKQAEASRSETGQPEPESSGPAGNPFREPVPLFVVKPQTREKPARPEPTVTQEPRVIEAIRTAKTAPLRVQNLTTRSGGRRMQLVAGIRYRLVPNPPVKTTLVTISQKRPAAVEQTLPARRGRAATFIRSEAAVQQNQALGVSDDAAADAQVAPATLTRAA